MATSSSKRRRSLRTRSAGFGGGLGFAQVRNRRRSPSYGLSGLPGGLGSALLASISQQRPVPAASNIAYAPPPLSGGTGGYDVNSDPAVAAAQGLAAKIRANAQASALAKIKQAAIEYGDPTGIDKVDEETAKAARENPFSVLKNLEHTYDTGKRDLEEGLNQANLYYSGYRGQQLGEAARQYEQNRYGAGTAFKGLLTDINDQLANALLQADMYEANALLGSGGGAYGGGDDSYGGGVSTNDSGFVSGPWQTYPGSGLVPGRSTKKRRRRTNRIMATPTIPGGRI